MVVLLSQEVGYLFLVLFGIAMIFITVYYSKKIKDKHNTKSFLVANRNVGMLFGAFSIAASWIWAPALFISSQKAFQQGLPGIFWFTVPNILALVVFAFLAVRIRKIIPHGYTLPQFIKKRFDTKTHIAYLFSFLSFQVFSLAVQLIAGALIINWFTGIPFINAVVLITIIFLIYSLLSGLEASIITDFVQMTMILIISILIVPWTIIKAGGFNSVVGGLGGLSGQFTNIFDPSVAYSFGIIVTIALLAGPIGDQQHWQRAFAIKKRIIKKTYILAAIIFAFVPILLALLGFIAANNSLNMGWDLSNTQVVGAVAVSNLLPIGATMLFILMLLAGLSSTGDSALCAGASLGAIDIYRGYINPKATDKKIVFISRITMLIIAILGMSIALIPNIKILHLFLFYGTLRAATMIPTILSLFWKKMSANATFFGVVLAIIIGLPMFSYGSIINDINIQVLGSLYTVMISLVVVLVISLIKPDNFDYKQIENNDFNDFN